MLQRYLQSFPYLHSLECKLGQFSWVFRGNTRCTEHCPVREEGVGRVEHEVMSGSRAMFRIITGSSVKVEEAGEETEREDLGATIVGRMLQGFFFTSFFLLRP